MLIDFVVAGELRSPAGEDKELALKGFFAPNLID